MAILVTGWRRFIGSHTVIELQNAGYDVVVVDNLANSVIPGTCRKDHRKEGSFLQSGHSRQRRPE